jgi:hypothetical protein
MTAIGLGAALGLTLISRSGGADTVEWIGGSSGNWNVAANWTDTTTNKNKTPGSSDDVDILDAIISLVSKSFTIQDLTLSNSGLSNGTLTVSGNAALSGANSFNSATINVSGSFTQTGGSLLLDAATVKTTTLSLNNGALLDLYQNPALKVTNITFGNTGGDTTPGSLQLEGNGGNPAIYTLASGTTLSGNLGSIGTAPQIDGNLSQLVNNGTILLNTNGVTTTVGGGNLSSFTNNGTITVSNGATLALTFGMSNAGAFTIDTGGTLSLTGGSTLTGSSAYSIKGTGSFTGTNTLLNSTVNVTGALNQVGGNLVLDGSTLTGNINIDNGAILDLIHNPTLAANVTFGNVNGDTTPSSLQLEGNGGNPAIYTIASSATLTGNLGGIGTVAQIDGNLSQLVNNGTILLNTNGVTTTVGGGNLSSFTNNGTITVSNGATLALTFGMSNAGAFTIDTGGTLALAGGSTLTGDSAYSIKGTGSFTGTNTLLNSTVNVTGALNQVGGNLVLDGSTLTGNINIDNGAILDLIHNPTLSANVTFGNVNGDTTPGSLQLEGNGGNPAIYTIASSATLTGNLGGIGTAAQIDGNASQLVNDGTILLNASGLTTTVGGGNLSSFTNNGTITVSNGATLALIFGMSNAGAFTIDTGGTLSLTGGSTLTGDSAYSIKGTGSFTGTNTLLNSTVNVTGALNQVSGSLVLDGSTLTGNINIDNGAILDLIHNPTLAANVTFGNVNGDTTPGSLQLEGNGGNPVVYTIASSATLTGNLGGIGTAPQIDGNASQLVNNGTILLNINGVTTTVGGNLSSFTNNGAVTASNGANLEVDVPFTNSGAFTVDKGSAATLNNAVVQTAGRTRINGAVTLASGQDLQLQGGDLVGTGSIDGSVTNTGGTVHPGDLLAAKTTGTLHITGDYSQSTNGATSIDLGGTTQGDTYSLLKVDNSATLAGTLDVKLVDGFTPTIGEKFDFMTYGTLTGGYNSNVVSLNNGYAYSLSYSNNGASAGTGILTVTAVAAVPEASSLLSASLMLGAGGLLLRRRSRRDAQPSMPQQ